MPLAITTDHRDITNAVRSLLSDHDTTSLARRVVDEPTTDTRPLWAKLAELGWVGLHLPSEFGGADVGLPEAALVAEELGRHLAPVPYLATAATSAAIAAHGDGEQLATWLPGLADGSVPVGLGTSGALSPSGDSVSGDAGLVVGAIGAEILALAAGDDLLLVHPEDGGVTVLPAMDFEPTLHLARVSLDGARPRTVIRGAAHHVRHIARVLAAAEAAGGARATLDAALGYAKVREQFGRPIGSFQAIKHHLANMLATSELATATAWDAARAGAETGDDQAAIAVETARAITFDAYVTNAEKSIQIHGGIGFTWEHDCHLFLRRAHALRSLFGGTNDALDALAALGSAGVRRHHAVDLPAEAMTFREEARAFVSQYNATAEGDRRSMLVDSGYLMPHWPKPYGRAASPVEQLVIEEELTGVEMPNLGIGAWILLTLSQHGTPEQVDRWLRPGLLGDLVWCQLFSEPGAGSDAAAVSTRAVKVDGGWRITGQKVWTSNAQNCNRGLATVRTNREVPKHKGITAVVVDLHAPGVTVRPLREITGEAVFNEVFFDDVFVPDEDVVGAVDNGWAVARATLGNERVSIGGGTGGGDERSAYSLFDVATRYAPGDVSSTRAISALLADEQAMGVLNVRTVVRAVEGGEPGAEGSVTKMIAAEHSQRVGELGLQLAGPAVIAGDEPTLTYGYLISRAMTIAGGTSEINRNVIAERLLGLPREQIAN